MENNQENEREKIRAGLWTKLVNFGLEFAVMIAAPLVGGIYLGRWLDFKYHQKFFIVIGILAALALSSYMIYKKIKEVKDILNDKN